MVPYAKPSGRLVGQIVADVVTVVVSVGSYLAGRAVYRGILALTDPLSATAKALSGLQDRVADAAVQAGQIPGVGDSLRSPLDDIAGQIASASIRRRSFVGDRFCISGIGRAAMPREGVA